MGMAELVEAYDALLDDDLAARLQDSAVASSCEAFPLEELAAGNLHDVYTLRVLDLEVTVSAGSTWSGEAGTSGASEALTVADDGSDSVLGVPIPTLASLDDSILDLKRALQSAHGAAWGLQQRPKDRQGVAAGWEVVYKGSALSYHLFLHDYGLQHRSIFHAVVRRIADE